MRKRLCRQVRKLSLSIAQLARRVNMSPRNFARRFTREVGMTPARFVISVRVETARRRLEESAEHLEAIAANCGFGTTEAMRRAFLRRIGIPPNQYRERFHRHPAPDDEAGGSRREPRVTKKRGGLRSLA